MTRRKGSKREREKLQREREKSQKKIEETSKSDNDGSIYSDALDNESIEIVTDVAQPSTTGQSERPNKNQTSEGRKQRKSMYLAALRGDWKAAEELLRQDRSLASAKITRTDDTALHIAAAFKRTKFVRELVKCMEPSDLSSVPNKAGNTALYYAAASGIRDIAAVMMGENSCMGKNSRLPTILGNKMPPLRMAILLGNRDMVSYLHKCTQVKDLPIDVSSDLFEDAISNRMYDVALKILENDSRLATKADEVFVTALHWLAQHNISDIRSCREAILEGFVTVFAAFPCLSWLKRKIEQPLMTKKARLLVEKLWAKIQGLEQDKMLELITPILHVAAEAGNVEFLTMLTRTEPDLIWDTNNDSNNYTIFHIAVSERQESVFRLIHQVGGIKYLIAASVDGEGNNILHLAGKLAPSSRLSIVAGAALQMQREIMWFKEMEKILPSLCLNMENDKGLQPRELFSEEHKDLLKEGEIWMRDTADSCMLIATIMLTVAFTAAFTVPGGNNSETGIPILFNRTWFKVFLVYDAVAMFSATFSIMMFLSILTSRFQEDDFLVSLPRKLFFGIAGLFGSLVGTISAFTSAYFLIFNAERAWHPMVLGYLACVLLTIVFLYHHKSLILDTMSSSFRCQHLFRSSKHSLY